MEMSDLMILAITVILASVVPTNAEDWQLYSTVGTGGNANLPNTLITVNHQTGEQIQRGSQGATPEQSALDVDPISGFLFGVIYTRPGVITRIDSDTGQWSEVATLQENISALAFSPTGTLYGVSRNRILGTINLETGTFSSIATLDIPSRVAGMDFSPQGVLYIIDSTSDEPFQQWVRVVDVSTGNITSTIPTGTFNVGDIDFAPDGYIYHTNYSWFLIRIDPSTGTQTSVGSGSLGPLGGIASAPPTLPVYIDIKPGSCPNSVNVKNKDVLPVAILGTEDFDVQDVSWAILEGIRPIKIDYDDVTTPIGDDAEECECNEAGPDGYMDLVLHFDTQEIVGALGLIKDGDVLELTLMGEDGDGSSIVGSDCIRVIKKGKD